MFFKRITVMSALAVILAVAPATINSKVAAVGPPQRFVNATSGSDVANDCSASLTPCKTIQHGVDESNAGDTINVAPGVYREQVKVQTANLTITGSGALIQPVAAVVNTSSIYSGDGIAAVIVVNGVTGVTIDQLTIDGSVAGTGRGCGPTFVGIFYRAASGVISLNDVANIDDPLNTGCQGYLGIFVQSGNGGPGLNSNVLIDSNVVNDYGKNGITANEAGTLVTVTGNTIIGQGSGWLAAQNGVQLGFGAHGKVTNNTIRNNYYSTSTYVACGVLSIYAGGAIGQTKTNLFADNSVNVCTGGYGPSANSPFNR